jgi:hypothetical protein
MTVIIVDDGEIEVYCRDYEQALGYLDVLKSRGHKNFILKEVRHEEQSTGQVRKDIQEPIESHESRPFVGL